ncbi:hypothetical protein BX666DRAFT_1851331 [Dichotomocladium elegans]|nr:hypothetical protein BX666DRAFT_1851331 [Dichotomocladium elegans]
MRLLAVFFRAENSKSQLISPEFIFFPTWLLHLFRYSKHDNSPGRTDIRFLENSLLAKEDHIYRLNNVLNTLFRFNIYTFDHTRFQDTVSLTNYLFDGIGLDELDHLPRPTHLPSFYAQLIYLLQAPRPTKKKPMCNNCNSKPASRRRLCVACYRYQLKHDEPRPLRLIVANQSVHSSMSSNNLHISNSNNNSSSRATRPSVIFYANKFCANCGVQETHQWYRNLCGNGHWCETCKSYFLRHSKVRPAELFVKAAKRKVDVRALVNWWPEEVSAINSPPPLATNMSISSSSSSGSTSPVSLSSTSSFVEPFPTC